MGRNTLLPIGSKIDLEFLLKKTVSLGKPEYFFWLCFGKLISEITVFLEDANETDEFGSRHV